MTKEGGAKWRWSPVTRDSTADNIRPIVPKWDSRNCALRGRYTSYTNYELDVVGIIGKR